MMAILPSSFSTLVPCSSAVSFQKSLDEQSYEKAARKVEKLLKLRSHIFELMKSSLLVKAGLVSPTHAAEYIRSINRELANRVVGGLKSQGNKHCRHYCSNQMISDLDAVAQELRTTIRVLDRVLGNVIDEVEDLKSNKEQLDAVVKHLRASLTAVLEDQRRVEKIITFSRLSSD